MALFVYSRPEQLRRTLDCLRRNSVERLYVFSDAAADPGVTAEVDAVREIVRAVTWTDPVIVEQVENLGLSASIRAGLDVVFAEHGQAIVIEDDVCVAPEFYEYARAALRAYESSQRVAGVTGLRYPFARAPLAAYPFDAFMSPRFSSWGWATWKDRWDSFEFDRDVLRRRLAERGDLAPQRAGADMGWMVQAAVVDETLSGSWDVVCATNMLLNDQYFVTPTWNMVENSGLVEGTHQTGRAPAWDLAWEPDHMPDPHALRFPPVVEDEDVLRVYRDFFALGRRQALVAALARKGGGLRRRR